LFPFRESYKPSSSERATSLPLQRELQAFLFRGVLRELQASSQREPQVLVRESHKLSLLVSLQREPQASGMRFA
jgi:hypothetical protein